MVWGDDVLDGGRIPTTWLAVTATTTWLAVMVTTFWLAGLVTTFSQVVLVQTTSSSPPVRGVDFFTDFRAAEGVVGWSPRRGLGWGSPNPAQFSFDAGSGSVFFDAVPNDAIAPVQFAGLLQNLGFGGLNPAADILFSKDSSRRAKSECSSFSMTCWRTISVLKGGCWLSDALHWWSLPRTSSNTCMTQC